MHVNDRNFVSNERAADCQIYTETIKDALAIQGEIMAIKEASGTK
jgi:hypothetical protein